TSIVPSSPPIRLGTMRRISVLRGVSETSFRKPHAPAIEPGKRAPVLVPLANTEFWRTPNSVGNVYKVPPPANEFCTPAANAVMTSNEKVSKDASGNVAFSSRRKWPLARGASKGIKLPCCRGGLTVGLFHFVEFFRQLGEL